MQIENREAIRGLELLRIFLFILGLFLVSGCEPLPATDSLKEVPEAYWGWMKRTSEQHATYLLLAVAILPGFGCPVSPLLILCGTLKAKTGSMFSAWMLTSIAMWVNAAWTYFFASGPGRAFSQKLLDKFSKNKITIPQAQGYELAILLRVTPGVPLPFQNYFLGVSGVSPKVYWTITLPVQGAWVYGFLVFGDGLLQGNSKLIITGIGLLVALALIARMLSSKFKKDTTPSSEVK